MSHDPNFIDRELPTPPPGARIGENIESETVDVCATPLLDCTLRNCVLRYDGTGPTWFVNVEFDNCKVLFEGAAGSTVSFMMCWARLKNPEEPYVALARDLMATALPDNVQFR